jgi:hypothetical protein
MTKGVAFIVCFPKARLLWLSPSPDAMANRAAERAAGCTPWENLFFQGLSVRLLPASVPHCYYVWLNLSARNNVWKGIFMEGNTKGHFQK